MTILPETPVDVSQAPVAVAPAAVLTLDLMDRMWPKGNSKIPGLIEGIVATAPQVFAKYHIDTPLLVAHVMAQFSEECGAGDEVEENLNYTSPARIAAVWPSRFNTATAAAYVRNPQKLADKVYDGRMGNRAGTDDGWNYRGRGASQTTGEEGYAKLGKALGLDLLGHPELVNDPTRFLEAGVCDFILCGCLPYAQRDDIRGVTHHLNGGYIGLADRQAWLTRWKTVLAAVEPAVVDDGTLRFGSNSYEVKALQQRLTELGYTVGAVDGDFGNGTRAAVLAFQADNGLATDGEVGDETRRALETAPPKPVTEARATATADDLRAKGSKTVAAADKVNTIAKGGVVLGGLVGTAKTVTPDNVQDTITQITGLRAIAESAHELGAWAADHWWLGVLVAGSFLWFYGRKVIAARLADHQSGNNMSK